MSLNPLHLVSPAMAEKLASEVVAADLNFAKLKDFLAGETITGTPTVTYTGADAALVLGSFVANVFTPAATPVVNGTIVQAGVSGGTAGVTYEMTYQVTTSGGKTRKRRAALLVI